MSTKPTAPPSRQETGIEFQIVSRLGGAVGTRKPEAELKESREGSDGISLCNSLVFMHCLVALAHDFLGDVEDLGPHERLEGRVVDEVAERVVVAKGKS